MSGRRITTPPRSLDHRLADAVYNFGRYRDYRANIGHIEKLVNLPDIPLNLKVNLFIALTGYRAVEVSWKDLLAFIKKCAAGEYEYSEGVSLKRNLERFKGRAVISKYNLGEYIDYIDMDNLDYFEVKAFREGFKNAFRNRYIGVQNAIVEAIGMSREELVNFGVRFSDFNPSDGVYKIYTAMRQLKQYAALLNLTDFKPTNIERDAEELRTRYEKEKTEIENRNFAAYQTSVNLAFEYGEYEIEIPMSREELASIGKTFNNCANHWEWDSRLCNGSYHLVVVRHKETKKRKVCVDIRATSLEIGQYYGYNNSRIYDGDLNDFYNAYRHHLRELYLARREENNN